MTVRGLVLSTASLVGGRSEQQDAFDVAHGRGRSAFTVADGLGGHPGGAAASKTASAAAVRHLLWSSRLAARRVLVGNLMETAGVVQSALDDAQRDGKVLLGSATTIVSVLIDSHIAWITTIGDCRCTVVRAGAVYETTTPHNLLAESERDGSFLETAANHRTEYAASVTRSLGPGMLHRFDVGRVALLAVPLKEGDAVLLTSDGVHGVLSLAEIAEMTQRGIADGLELQLAEILVDRAVSRAGSGADNTTAIVVVVDREENK